MTTYTTPHNLPIIEPATDQIKSLGTPSALAGAINSLARAVRDAISAGDASVAAQAAAAKSVADGVQARADTGEFNGAPGLPGVNAVANDTATAGYIGTTGTSQTLTALLARFASLAGGNRFTDTPSAKSSMLDLNHHGDGSNGQTYGLDIHNFPGAHRALVIHQYSDKSAAITLDNTDTAPTIQIRNTRNASYNPGREGTGDFFQFVPLDTGGDANSLALSNDLVLLNKTGKVLTVRTGNNHRALLVDKTGAGAGEALRVQNAGTGNALSVFQSGQQVAVNIGSSATGLWALQSESVTHGADIRTSADNGETLSVMKRGTGAGVAAKILNAGTGRTLELRTTAGAIAAINANGEYENLTPNTGPIIRSPNGTRYRVKVADNGTLTAAAA